MLLDSQYQVNHYNTFRLMGYDEEENIDSRNQPGCMNVVIYVCYMSAGMWISHKIHFEVSNGDIV